MAKQKRTPKSAPKGSGGNPDQRNIIPETARGSAFDAERSSPLTDYLIQYIGSLSKTPTPESGVYRNYDRIVTTQQYLNFFGYDLYDLIEADPHYNGILQTLKYTIAGTPYSVTARKAKDAREEMIASWVEEKLGNIRDFSSDIVQMLDAVGKGFSALEIMWAVDNEGFVIPNELLHRPQRRVQFDAVSRTPKIKTMSNAFYGDPMPDRKFIIHRNQTKYETPFGDALDEKIYWSWLFKKNVIKMWMQHLETAAGPIPIVTHPANANADLKAEALSLAGQLRNGSYARKPDNMTIDYAEAKSAAQASQSYEGFIRFANDEMTKCVLGEVLTTEGASSGGHGSKAGASESRTIQKARLQYYAMSLENTLNSTLIPWMVDYNFLGVTDYPNFSFDLSEAPDIKLFAETINLLKQANWETDADWIEENIGIPVTKTAPQPSPFIPQPNKEEGVLAE